MLFLLIRVIAGVAKTHLLGKVRLLGRTGGEFARLLKRRAIADRAFADWKQGF
jgi:hypothetical protein